MIQREPCLRKTVKVFQADLPLTRKTVKVFQADLPLTCPQKDETTWNGHPKVFLHLDDAQKVAICPYCETHYELSD